MPRRRTTLPWLVASLAIGAAVVGFSPRASAAPSPEREQMKIADQAAQEAQDKAHRRKSSRPSKARMRPETEVSRTPRMGHPVVHQRPAKASQVTVGWSGAAARPRFHDRRRRLWTRPVPNDYGSTLHLGERFVFDVYFAGNPAGMAEAAVIGTRQDPRGGPPAGSDMYVLQGKATTSGVVSLLTSMVDVMTTVVDQETGAPLRSVNVLDRSGLGTKYKKRVTETDFEGRGHLRIVDVRDGKTTKRTRSVPMDTFDPLSAMAWVRSLDLDDGERASAHVIDGKTLLRVDIVGRGIKDLDPMPSIATGLGLGSGDLKMLEGVLTRVDRYGHPRPGKRAYTFRAYVSDDDRRLLLAIETDMWLGVIRLVLARYDPPRPTAGTKDSP